MAGIFPKKEPKKPDDPQAHYWAVKFLEALKEKGIHKDKKGTRMIAQWSKVFGGLIKGKGLETVESLLNWYLPRIGKSGILVCISAEFLMLKWNTLVKQMQADESDDSGEIPQRDKDMAAHLQREFKYPIEIQTHLPLISFRTRKNWGLFLQSLQNADMLDISSREMNFAQRVVEAQAPVFVYSWLYFLSQKFGWMESYSQPLSLVWTPNNENFKNSFWRKWSNDWTANPTAFDSLLERLLK